MLLDQINVITSVSQSQPCCLEPKQAVAAIPEELGAQTRFYAYATSVNAVGLLVILPVLSKLFHLHDSLLLTICVGTEAGGNDRYNCRNVQILIPDVLSNLN